MNKVYCYYYFLCPGALKTIQFMGLQCTIFSAQGDSNVYSLRVYNVLYSICPGGLNCIQFMGLQCTVLSVQADSSVYSLWVYNVLFSLSRRTPVYTVYGLQLMYYSDCPGGLKCLQCMDPKEGGPCVHDYMGLVNASLEIFPNGSRRYYKECLDGSNGIVNDYCVIETFYVGGECNVRWLVVGTEESDDWGFASRLCSLKPH